MDNDQDAARFSTGAPPTATYETPVATAPARRGISPAIVAVVAVVALAAGFGAGYAAHGSGTASKKTVTVHGSLTLAQGAYKEGDGTGCTAGDGYSDISPGTAVTIGDDTGATLAVGQLQAGQVTGGGCEFGFDVKVPAGRTSYTVTVSHRGTQVFSADQIGAADMTLG